MNRSRASEEMAKILSDGKWHSTHELATRIGDYIRPEIIWRTQRAGYTKEGAQRSWALGRLLRWKKMGLIEKHKNGDTTEWKCTNLPGLMIPRAQVTAEELLKVSYYLMALAKKLKRAKEIEKPMGSERAKISEKTQ